MSIATTMQIEALHTDVLAWFDEAGRDLPWRVDPQPWRVMVSEFMLQQTPVARVLPVFEAWMRRWPIPALLAADDPGEAVRAWGKLGYPRRAQRLHASAVAIVERHDGEVPADVDALRALPGVGDYTAAAIASFAFGQRHVVLDTNVRRVFARTVQGVEFPETATSATERGMAMALLPDRDAHQWAAATMELGAVVCTAKSPRCGACPVEDRCAWNAAGRPAHTGPPRRGQAYAGTDRQVRGRLLDIVRASDAPVARAALDAAWDDAEQRERCLQSLLADGLVTQEHGRYRL
ncbi:MAG TPA: A/G-specific adenine glycosylase [Aeromicrobium sp.]|nr:A/G-specific adenine glycosylase [Aeromicrobium sp.]